jgi:hypothetical protein
LVNITDLQDISSYNMPNVHGKKIRTKEHANLLWLRSAGIFSDKIAQ